VVSHNLKNCHKKTVEHLQFISWLIMIVPAWGTVPLKALRLSNGLSTSAGEWPGPEVCLMQCKSRLVLAAACAGAMFIASTPARADLVGHWDFDGTLNDATANANNGTFAGGPLPSYSGDIPAAIGTGQSLLFGGATGHVLVPDSDSLDIESAITIAAWVKPNGNISFDGIVAKSPSDGSLTNHAGNYELRLENGTRVPTFHYQRGSANDTLANAGQVAVANSAWQHVAVTATKGGHSTFYVNGIPSGPTALGGLFGATNNNALYIGTRADLFTTMDGWIDDLRIYDNALSTQEIFQIANPGVDPGVAYPAVQRTWATASSFYPNDNRNPQNAVNGSGLAGRIHQPSAPAGTMWLANASDLNATFDVDLGSVHAVNELRVWNYNENAGGECCLGRGVSLANIYVAGADGVFDATPVLENWELDAASGTTSDFSQAISLGGVEARFVRIAVLANHGDPTFVGISEVKVAARPIEGQYRLPATVSSVSSQLHDMNFSRAAQNVVNGSGLAYGDVNNSVLPESTMWLSNGTFAAPNDLDPQITFDLGSVQPIATMKVWNYAEGADGSSALRRRGVALADVYVAGEDGVFELLYAQLELDMATGVVDNNPLTPALLPQLIEMGGIEARYVRLENLVNHGGDANFVGLSEVQFLGVPEPSTYLLTGLGIAGLAWARRREESRRRKE
jgi:hypothetical protein